MVAYAAKAGQVAHDGDDDNSPFMKALLNRLKQRGLEISMLFRFVRDDVMAATGRQQEPFVYGSLPSEPFYFPRPRWFLISARPRWFRAEASRHAKRLQKAGCVAGRI
jgi:hypothetical protein